MKRRLVIVPALLCVAAMLLPGCNDDTAQIQTCFEEYKQALIDGDGRAAVDMVSDGTIEYYEEVLDLALEASPDQVRALDLLDRLQVLSLRHRVSIETLRRMDGYDLFVFVVDERFLTEDTVAEGNIGAVTVTGDKAIGAYTMNGRSTTLEWSFVREHENWNVDVMSLRSLYTRFLKQVVRESGMSENEFLIMHLEEATDRGVRLDIWQPMGRG